MRSKESDDHVKAMLRLSFEIQNKIVGAVQKKKGLSQLFVFGRLTQKLGLLASFLATQI